MLSFVSFQGPDVTFVTRKSYGKVNLRMKFYGEWQTGAELKMAVVAAASNIPLAFHDKLSPTIRNIFQIPNLPQNTTQHPQKLPAC